MRNKALGVLCSLGMLACASAPVASGQLVDSKVAIRSAQQAGAEKVPSAARHLELAQEQMQVAQRFIDDSKKDEAVWALQRASADADLALALAQEAPVREEAQRMQQQVRALQQQN